MDRTQHVLDAIDGALEDWTVSGDAMRWTPEPPAVVHVAPGRPLVGGRPYAGPVTFVDNPVQLTLVDNPVQRLLERSMWYWSPELDAEQMRRTLERLGLTMQPVMEAAQRMAEVLGRGLEEFTPLLAQMTMRPQAEPRPEPEDPRERALRLRQQRHTGPSQDVTRQRRPRLHVG